MPVITLTPDAKHRLTERLEAARHYFAQALPADQVDASQYGVDSSTIRAFHGFNKPLATYRAWAARVVPSFAVALERDSQEDFDRWYKTLVVALATEFGGQTLAPYQRHKLADLFLKWVARCSSVPPEARAWILEFAHCPLDSYSLSLLKEIVPGTVLNNAEPRMSVIDSEAAYNYVQEIIREICIQVPCRPLHFDFIAWNAEH